MPGKRKFEIVESLPSTYGASQGSRRNPAKRPKRTTQLLMSRSLPFPVSKKTQMVYTYGYAQPASAAFDYFTIACNDMFDLDRTTLESWEISSLRFWRYSISTGPYKNYYVESWETTWTVVNMTSVPVRMYVAPALNVSTEVDSQTEAENFPGVVIRDITHNDGSQNKVSVKVRGSVKDIYPTSSKDINFVGTYGASPTTSIFGTLCLASRMVQLHWIVSWVLSMFLMSIGVSGCNSLVESVVKNKNK